MWPSGDATGVLLLKRSLDETRSRLAASGVDASPIYSADADDGLGVYRGFHIQDVQIGLLAFLSYLHAPERGTRVLVDASQDVRSVVRRLHKLLKFSDEELVSIHPNSNDAKLFKTAKTPEAEERILRQWRDWLAAHRNDLLDIHTAVRFFSNSASLPAFEEPPNSSRCRCLSDFRSYCG